MRRSAKLAMVATAGFTAVASVAFSAPVLKYESRAAMVAATQQQDNVRAENMRHISSSSIKVDPSLYEKADVQAEQLRLQRVTQVNAQRTQLAEIRTSKQLTPKQLARLLSHVGFEGEAHRLAWGIVMRESTGRPNAHNDNPATGDDSYGLFQINMYGSLGPSRVEKFELKKESDLLDPVVNAEIAHHMSAGGKDFGAWGFGPNAYKYVSPASLNRHMDKYPGEVE